MERPFIGQRSANAVAITSTIRWASTSLASLSSSPSGSAMITRGWSSGWERSGEGSNAM